MVPTRQAYGIANAQREVQPDFLDPLQMFIDQLGAIEWGVVAIARNAEQPAAEIAAPKLFADFLGNSLDRGLAARP